MQCTVPAARGGKRRGAGGGGGGGGGEGGGGQSMNFSNKARHKYHLENPLTQFYHRNIAVHLYQDILKLYLVLFDLYARLLKLHIKAVKKKNARVSCGICDL